MERSGADLRIGRLVSLTILKTTRIALSWVIQPANETIFLVLLWEPMFVRSEEWVLFCLPAAKIKCLNRWTRIAKFIFRNMGHVKKTFFSFSDYNTTFVSPPLHFLTLGRTPSRSIRRECVCEIREDECHLPEFSSESWKEDLSSNFEEIIIYPSPKFGYVDWLSVSLKLLWQPHFDMHDQVKFGLSER